MFSSESKDALAMAGLLLMATANGRAAAIGKREGLWVRP